MAGRLRLAGVIMVGAQQQQYGGRSAVAACHAALTHALCVQRDFTEEGLTRLGFMELFTDDDMNIDTMRGLLELETRKIKKSHVPNNYKKFASKVKELEVWVASAFDQHMLSSAVVTSGIYDDMPALYPCMQSWLCVCVCVCGCSCSP